MTEEWGSFGEFMRRATGYGPFPFQRRVAEEGLPELLRVPPGSGKTEAAVLTWLWRLGRQRWGGVPGEPVVPGRLVYVLPMRSLVEQVAKKTREWLGELGLAERVGLHVLMGGEARDDDAWQLDPFRPAVFVGTQDMVLSRLLMRGYGDRRARWPVPFGLLHGGSQFVFDETQLMGPALATSVQLQALRERLGTVVGSSSMWMSATVEPWELVTADRPVAPVAVELSEEDRRAPYLAERLLAGRRFEQVEVGADSKGYADAVARVLRGRHVPGTRTLAFFNTVRRAVEVEAQLTRLLAGEERAPDVVLVHSQFRPGEREALVEQVKATPSGAGQVVISTQALEAGVDISSRVLFTEVAPWTSVIQRCGRCNRTGEYGDGAEVLWAWPPGGAARAAPPYEEADLLASAAALEAWEGRAVTATEMLECRVEQARPEYLHLRRRDLLQLWDTMPDLTGADVDVGRWIRDGDDLSGLVAWRAWEEKRPGEEERFPGRRELCPAPLSDLRQLADKGRLWHYDQVDRRWVRTAKTDVRPTIPVVMDAAQGGYDPRTGWAPASRTAVAVVENASVDADGTGGDGGSCGSTWVPLAQHGADAERELTGLLDEFGKTPGLSAAQRKAALVAARHHDIGKAHRVMQESLRDSAGEKVPPGPGPWAKSPGKFLRHSRRYFRHELVSALMMLDPASGLLDGVEEKDLAVYLAAAHHGKVRLGVRSVSGEAEGDRPRLLGVETGDVVGPVETADGAEVPQLKLDLSVLALGGGAGRSWVQRVTELRDRPDAGPFRVGWLEAMVRVADWRASAAYRREAAAEPAEDDASPEIAGDDVSPDVAPGRSAACLEERAAEQEQGALW